MIKIQAQALLLSAVIGANGRPKRRAYRHRRGRQPPFARELMAQELGITLLISRGVEQSPTASGDDLTASDDPTRKMMRQIAGAFAEYEKARLVDKLRHARERVRQEKGKCEGRKPHGDPEAVALAKRLTGRLPRPASA